MFAFFSHDMYVSLRSSFSSLRSYVGWRLTTPENPLWFGSGFIGLSHHLKYTHFYLSTNHVSGKPYDSIRFQSGCRITWNTRIFICRQIILLDGFWYLDLCLFSSHMICINTHFYLSTNNASRKPIWFGSDFNRVVASLEIDAFLICRQIILLDGLVLTYVCFLLTWYVYITAFVLFIASLVCGLTTDYSRKNPMIRIRF